MARARAVRIVGFEDARADEHRLGAQLHHQRGVGRSRDAARREVRHRQLAVLAATHSTSSSGACRFFASCTSSSLPSTVSCFISLTMVRMWRTASTMLPRAGLALGADHRRAFGDAPQRFAQIARAADERHFEVVLVDVVLFVGGRQHFALVDVIDAQRFENARFREVADARLGHHRNA